MLSVYTVCFFGHRVIDDFQETEKKVEKIIDKILNEHEYVEFLIGREGDFDQIVSSAILRYKKKSELDNCSLTWVMPYMKAEYKHNLDSFEKYYDSIELCEQSANAHPKAAIQIRNRAMVDRSDLCVFFVNQEKGGAYQTLKYAEKRGVQILRI